MISEQNRVAIALEFVFRRLQRKCVGVHVTPIGVLQCAVLLMKNVAKSGCIRR